MEHVVEAKPGVTPIETKIAEYSPTAAGLADLQHRFQGVVFDVTTTKGIDAAKAARYELVKLRTGLETKRKELKAPALERSRLIDAEAARITNAIAELEDPIDDQIKVEERRKETEKQVKIEAEAARVAGIRESIAAMSSVALRAMGRPAADIEAKIRLVVAVVRDENRADFAEFLVEAEAVQADTLTKLRELHAAAVKAEADALELARLREADAERKRTEEARAAAERQAEAQRLAEARQQLEADERAAAARRKEEDDRADAARAEADRVARAERDAEQRRIDAQRAEERRQQDERDQAAREERASEEARITLARNALRLEQEGRDRAEQEERQAESDRLLAEARAAEAAQTRLQAAAGPMLDALLLWRTVDASGRPKQTDAYKQAAAARDAAIALATEA